MKTKVDKESLVIAKQNGISTTTVYNRVNRGWNLEKAITIPTDHNLNSKREQSKLFSRKRGKTRITKLPAEWEEKYEQHLEDSGLTEIDFIAEIIGKYFGIE